MTKLIVDASAAASWLLASQSTPSAIDLLDRLGDFEPVAPHVFRWEIGNLLVRQARREPAFELGDAFAVLGSFDIASAPPLGRDAIRTLASRDSGLLAAAAAAGLPVFDLRG